MNIVRMFEEDPRDRKRLAELLISEENARLAMIIAVLKDVATRHDIEKLRNEFRDGIKELRGRVESIEQRLSRLEGRVDLLIKVFIGFNVPLLIAMIGILIKMVMAS